MAKKGENIYKRKDGRWEGRYIRSYGESGKAKYGYVYGKSYTEVKQHLLEKKFQSPTQSAPLANYTSTYNDVLTAWLQSTRLNIKESTYCRYLHLIDTHIRPSLGKYLLSRISTQLVEGFIEQELNSGRLDRNGGLSAKTVTDMLTIIKSTINYAVYNGLVVSCNLSKLCIKKKEKEMRVLSQSEQDALVKMLMTEMDLSKLGVLISLCTGIRIGELCALQWEDICLSTSTLKVRKTMQRIKETNPSSTVKTRIIITEPKSNCSIRDIPIPHFLMDSITRFAAHPKAYVLSGCRERYVEPRTMQNHFKHYVTESGIENANFHSLRHTFATRCIEVGFDVKTLSEILGHANVNITLNRYVHSSFDLKCANMNKLSFIK